MRPSPRLACSFRLAIRFAFGSGFACALVALAAVPPAVAGAACDTAGPQLGAFDFTPKTVVTTGGAQQVLCTMPATDDLSGVDTATCSFRSPTFLQNLSCTATAPATGTRLNGVFQCAVTIPRYGASGIWRAQVSLSDAVGNDTARSDIDLMLAGLPTDLNVTATPDVAAPALTGFDFNPKNVTVSAAAASVTCAMTLTDALSGVSSATCFLVAPDTEQAASCAANAPTSGTINNGTFQCVATIPRYADAGTWTANVFAQDFAGNFVFLDTATLAAQGRPTNLVVTSSPEDLAPPLLLGFDFNPKVVDTSSAAVPVTCTGTVTDALAGTTLFGCELAHPTLGQSATCATAIPTTGTANSGTFACQALIPRYADVGAWLANVQLLDRVGNADDLDAVALGGLGFPYELTGTCDGGPPPDGVVDLRFPGPSKDLMAWNPLLGAERYNMYRGTLDGLVDTDSDGAPDDGYGSCINFFDPNLANTTFVDPSPASPGTGYYYLATWTTNAQETGEGRRSDGVERDPSFRCP